MFGQNGKGLRYFPRLKVFKAGRNFFDGVEGRSYDWYKYAHVLLNGDVIEVDRAYSNVTSMHMSDLRHLYGHDKFKYSILAPRGLDNTEAARTYIKSEIKRLETELKNPRNRARDRRIAEIARLKAMLPIVKMLEKDEAARRRIAMKKIMKEAA